MSTLPAAPPRLSTLVLLSGLSALSLSMFLPSLKHIAEDFGADYALVNLSIAGYAAMTAVVQLIMGPLSDRFGRRPVIMAGLAVFALASLGCALAPDIATFLVFRMTQAAVVSAYSVSLAVIRDTAGTQQSASRLGYLTMAWAVAPMLGPVAGGALDELLGWRATFWVLLAFALAALGLAWYGLAETNTRRSETFASQSRAYPELVRSRRFWGYALCMAFSVGAFYAFLGGAPLVATTRFAMSSATLGATMGTITVGFILGSFLSGRLAERHALTTMVIAGRVIACAGLAAGLACLLLGIVHVVTFFGACACVGIGNGLTLPSSNAGAMSVRPELAGSASGLAGALTVGGGALVSAATGVVLTPGNAAVALLGMMLLTSTLALAAALYVLWVERGRTA